MKKKSSDLLTSEYMLLGLLDQKPTHGYELFKRINDAGDVGMIWRVRMSNLYAQLNKLERDGLITGALQPGDAHPARVQFSITPQGGALFDRWLNTVVTHPRDLRPVFLLKLFFLRQRSENKMLSDLLHSQLAECQRWQAEIEDKSASPAAGEGFNAEFLAYRRLVIRSQVDWLIWLIDRQD